MRDFSEHVGPPRASSRFPFERMNRVGGFFTAPGVSPRTLSVTMSSQWQGSEGRRFAVFSCAAGPRVFLVDIDDTASAAA